MKFLRWAGAAALSSLLVVTMAPHAKSLLQGQPQRAHAAGTCGSLGPGTGLRGGKGWIVSMLPGRHEVRVRGSGSVYLTVAKKTKMDFDAGRLYYIVADGLQSDSLIEWKVPGGKDWAIVATTFLYPP
jgi:hypothetical protein